MEYYIEYGGKKNTDIGVLLETADYGSVKARTNFEEVPYRNGAVNTLSPSGVFYERRTVRYTFICKGSTREETKEKAAQLIDWVSVISGEKVYDSYRDMYFQEVQFENAEIEYIDVFLKAARVTVTFSADPYLISNTGITTTLASAYGTLGAYIFDNKLVCSNLRGSEHIAQIDKIADRTYQVTIGSMQGVFDGILAFCHLGFGGLSEMEIESVSGAALYKINYSLDDGFNTNSYFGYGTMNSSIGGAVRFTITTANDVSGVGSQGGAWVGQAFPYSVDGCDNYYIDAYTAGEPQITVNGEEVSPRKFSLPPDKPVSYVKASSGQTGMYVLGYDSVEKRL